MAIRPLRRIDSALLPIALLFSTTASGQIVYPTAEKQPVSDNYFGTRVADPYQWMENDTASQTKEWVKEENDLSKRYLSRLLYKYPFENQFRFNSVVAFGSTDKEGAYFVDFMQDETQKTASLYLKKTLGEEPDLAVDPADYKKTGADIVRIHGYRISKDNKYIAFGLTYNGSDWTEIRVKSVYPFRNLTDRIQWVKFSGIEWRGDGFFYCTYDSLNKAHLLTAITRNPKIYYHQLGTSQDQDRLVFEDTAHINSSLPFSVMDQERYLVINHAISYKGKSYNKVSFIDFKADTPAVMDLILSTNYYDVIGMYNGKFLVLSYLPNGSLYLVSPDAPNQLETYIPEFKQTLEQATIVGDKVICLYLNDLDYLAITFDKDGKAANKITYPTGTSVDGFEGTEESKTLFYYHSILYPPIAYTYDVNTFEVKLIQRTEVNYNQADFEVRKVFYTSKDGRQIPMIIAGKRGFKLNGTNPTILYAYGGFGISETAFYDEGFLIHLQSGGLLAIPSIRGGGEYGQEWHRQGMLANKQTSFDDFIAAAEYLKKEQYTSTEKLAIMGGSNGGLLIGAVLTQRPDLCQVAVAEMGVFDMLRYQHYTIAYTWSREYGTSADSSQFRYLYKYSPLQNVKKVAYPATLIVTADHDDRVVPMHSYKFAATLQEKNTGSAPILLLTEKNAGHHGGDNYKEEASIYAFIYEQLKVNPAAVPH